MSGDAELKAHCDTCASIERCKHAFGKYWTDKSRGGIGCTYPLSAGAEKPVERKPPAPQPPPPAPPSTLRCDPVRRDPWQGRVFTTKRREGGVFQTRKRKFTTMKQGKLLRTRDFPGNFRST